MSASLVGSEMCIRDRRPVSLQCAPRGTEPGGEPKSSRAAPRDRMGPRACLLYTSDAADDM
eukprot:13849789-Alexandrium_andersonii.AAC.1